ncbi:MAG: hypothetical protein PHR77_14025 [Kiritimatiellae bacterium]|nr:hypothetical protein [Kiritimatiellia bacterium]
MKYQGRILHFFISFIILILAFGFCTSQAVENTSRNSTDRLAGFFAGPMHEVDEIVFSCRQPGKDGHYYANFGYYSTNSESYIYGAMGRLCKYNIKNKKLSILLEDLKGGIRDPQVHYNAEKILFSYRKDESRNYHLYEINVDGSNLRQITDGPYDDVEPTYLPDGGIFFCSTRCQRWVNCWFTPVAILYRCDADGKNIQRISSNIEHDNTPWPLPDGRILHTRWEYVDRSQLQFHHLWTMKADGTAQMVYFGNMNPGSVYIDAKPIPNSHKIVLIDSPGHGRREHQGFVSILDPTHGPDDLTALTHISSKEIYRDPYAFSENCIMIASGTQIEIMNGKGETATLLKFPENLAQNGMECQEPRPIIKRNVEPVLKSSLAEDKKKGTVILSNAYLGRNMEGVKKGGIAKLLVLEVMPKPVNFPGLFNGWTEPISLGGTFTLERILGTVPVEEDGSAYFDVPAGVSLFFVSLDDKNTSVKRMQSFFTVMPGEILSCVGCHEQRTKPPEVVVSTRLKALKSQPRQIKQFADMPDVFDFPRDIQPILNKYCDRCHNSKERAGHVILEGDLSETFSISYSTLVLRNQVSDARNRTGNRAPYTIGSSASPLLKKINGSHHDVIVSPREELMIKLWIDSAAVYAGTYASLGTGSICMKLRPWAGVTVWPGFESASKVLEKRCLSCHDKNKKGMILPVSPTDWGLIGGTYKTNETEEQRSISGHVAYNLSYPEKSSLLMVPLAVKAGGYAGSDKTKHKEVFASRDDAGYQTILQGIQKAKEALSENKRFEMPGFQPNEHYVREMKRYGILPPDFDISRTTLDSYETDRKYWNLVLR